MMRASRIYLVITLLPLLGCGSATETLKEAHTAFKERHNEDVREAAQTCTERWPDTPECAATRVLAAATAAADFAGAVDDGTWERASEIARTYDNIAHDLNATPGVDVPQDAIAMVLASSIFNDDPPPLFLVDVPCADSACTLKVSAPRAKDIAAAKAAALGSHLDAETYKPNDQAFTAALLHLQSEDPAGFATTWLHKRACAVAPRWEGWDGCTTGTLVGMEWDAARARVGVCAATSVLQGCAEVADRARESAERAAKRAARLHAVESTHVCASLGEARAELAPDTPRLVAIGVTAAPPLEWWDTFKGESELPVKLRVLAGIAVAADKKYDTLLPLFKRLTPIVQQGGLDGAVADELQAATHELMIAFGGLSTVMDDKRDLMARIMSGYASAQTLPRRYASARQAVARLEQHCQGWTVPAR